MSAWTDQPAMPISARVAGRQLARAPEQHGAVVVTLGTVGVGSRYTEVWKVDTGSAWYCTFGIYHLCRDTCYVGSKADAIEFAVRYLSAAPLH